VINLTVALVIFAEDGAFESLVTEARLSSARTSRGTAWMRGAILSWSTT
jgi:hypothetical protein